MSLETGEPVADRLNGKRPRRSPGPRPSAELAERRRTEILDAAAELFFRKGFANTSMDDVAASRGHTKGVIYHYFGSKREILMGIFVDVQEEGAVVYDDIRRTSDSAATAVQRTIDYLTTQMMQAKWRYAFLFASELKQNVTGEQAEIVMQKARTNVQTIVDIINTGIAEGVVIHADVGVLARIVIGTILEIGRWYDPAGRVPLDDLRAMLTRLVFQGIMSSESVANAG